MSDKKSFFCPAPWIQASCNTRGKTKYCYYADDSGKSVSLSEYWNSTDQESIRSMILNGVAPQGCSTCLKKENAGFTSRRQEYIQKGYNISNSAYPRELFLKFDSVCNLACRMCEPANSSMINQEAKKYDLIPYWNPVDTNFFQQDFNSILPGVRKVRVTGGEPLYSKKFLNFCQYAIDNGYAHNIDLRIITNGTLLDNSWFKIFDNFKSFSAVISVDGFKESYDYIRYPNKWKEMPLEYLISQSRIYKISFTFALQAYNYLDVGDFVAWCKSHGLIYSIHPVIDPDYLSCKILPKAEKQKVSDYFPAEFLKDSSVADLHKFFDFTDRLDKARGQNLQECLPKLWNTLTND